MAYIIGQNPRGLGQPELVGWPARQTAAVGGLGFDEPSIPRQTLHLHELRRRLNDQLIARIGGVEAYDFAEPGIVDVVKKAAEVPLKVLKAVGDAAAFPYSAIPKVVSLIPPLNRGGGPPPPGAKPKVRPALPAEHVCWIQTVLNKGAGQTLATDGIYGPKTRDAVRNFQEGELGRMGATGAFDQRTNTALIQLALKNLFPANLGPVNGTLSQMQHDAIVVFQQGERLPPPYDGIVGPRTRAAMVTRFGGRCPAPSVGPVGRCNSAAFERERQACRDQAISALVDCGVAFGLNEAQAVAMAGSAVALAATGTPITIAMAVAVALAAGITNLAAQIQAAKCIYREVQKYKACIEAAKRKTNCP